MKPVGTHRIHEHLQELAAINSDPASGGITREVFTADYMLANQYVLAVMERAGMSARVDAFGNLFGQIEGTAPDLPAVLTGSHIDTTLNAGAYDGVLGVLGGIEAIRLLLEDGWQPRRTVEVVCFAGEEPRFGSGCIGSRALMGTLKPADLDAMVDRDGISIADAMRLVGLDPGRIADARLDPTAIKAFVELHIEQGSRLERKGVPIGVVTHIAAPHDLLVTISGFAGHAGATPMDARRDALTGAAELILAVERLARESRSDSTVGTVGVIDARPGAINVIPGEVTLQVDIRDHDVDARTTVVDAFTSSVHQMATRRGLEYDIRTITRDDPATCADVVVDAARAACHELEVEYMEIVSGAYHDAMVLGAAIPIGMIFVPSRGGISHSPLEYTAPEELERGVAVLAATLHNLADD